MADQDLKSNPFAALFSSLNEAENFAKQAEKDMRGLYVLLFWIICIEIYDIFYVKQLNQAQAKR